MIILGLINEMFVDRRKHQRSQVFTMPPCGSGNRSSKASVFSLENYLHLVTIHQASIHVLPICISACKMLMLGYIMFLK